MKRTRWYFAILMTAAAVLAVILFLPGGALAQDDGTPGTGTGNGVQGSTSNIWHMEGWDLAQMQAHMAVVQSVMPHGSRNVMDGMMSAAGMHGQAGHGGMMQAMPEHMSGAMYGMHDQMHGPEAGTTGDPVPGDN